MFKNHIKTAFRSLRNNATFTILNLVSLVVGLMVIYIAIGYLRFENSYDEFHENSEQLYRVGRTQRTQDYATVGFSSWSDTDAANQLNRMRVINDMTGIEDASQFIISNDLEYLNYRDIELEQKGILTTNTPASFTQMFTWDLIIGNFETFSKVKNSVVLNETTARKLTTGSLQKLINKPLEIAGETYTIAAVIKDVPANSHFDFQIAAHREIIPYWGSNVYVQLIEGANTEKVLQQFNTDILKADPNLATNDTYKGHFFQKMTDIHLKSNILYELKTPGNSTYIYLIGAFGILIILITIFNYANFTIALKTKQSRTIGVRKVLGASNGSIALQFTIEAMMLVMGALPFLILCLIIAIPEFNQFMQVDLISNPLLNLETLALITGVSLAIGLLASIVPTILLASKDVLSLFKAKLTERKFENFSVRKYMIISQIAILIGVTSVSYFMYQQISYINNKDLGFQKEGLLYTFSSPENLDVLQEKLRAIPEVKVVGNGSSFGIDLFNQLEYKLEGEETIFDDSNQFYLDYNAIKAYDIKTTLPESVFESSVNRPNRNLINRSAAEHFAKIKGVPVNELIGTQIITEPTYQNEDGVYGLPFTIDGFYEDVNAFSLKESIKPYFITVSDRVRMGGMSIVSYDPNMTQTTVQKIQQTYAGLDYPFPLQIEYLDDKFEALHAQDTKTAQLIFILNGIAILLASIGITGVTLLLIVGRTKEIGIRKVLGASVAQILKLSVKEYVTFVVIGLVISAPIAYWVTSLWLNDFAYSTSIQPLVFVAAAVLVLGLTVMIVSIVSYKSAVANPVQSLKTE
jgi:putative ABC transport system permease protein